MIVILFICLVIILGILLLCCGDEKVYVVEFGTTRRVFLSKERADKFYSQQKKFYDECIRIENELDEIWKELKSLEVE